MNNKNLYFLALTEESEAASKQVLAKSEQIRKFQEENKYLGQLVSALWTLIAVQFVSV